MKVAVIPARGGSKRIPRKNIREFLGRPIISWSIDAAIGSQCFDRVIVSTDDHEIAEVAVNCGAEVPFMRPQELSDDFSGTAAVISHAVRYLSDRGAGRVEYACCIYATAPFVQPEDIRSGLSALTGSDAKFAFSVTRYQFPIQRSIKINNLGRVEMIHPEFFTSRSQDLEEHFHDAGQFYWGTAKAWIDEDPIFSPASIPVKIPSYRVQDIDDLDDWVRAELLMRSMQLHRH